MLPSRISRSLLIAAAVALLAGCDPSCEQVCDKLVACENEGTERMSSAECEEQCAEQRDLYATWSDVQLREAFEDELSCLYEAECADVAAGVCYDDAVFAF